MPIETFHGAPAGSTFTRFDLSRGGQAHEERHANGALGAWTIGRRGLYVAARFGGRILRLSLDDSAVYSMPSGDLAALARAATEAAEMSGLEDRKQAEVEFHARHREELLASGYKVIHVVDAPRFPQQYIVMDPDAVLVMEELASGEVERLLAPETAEPAGEVDAIDDEDPSP